VPTQAPAISTAIVSFIIALPLDPADRSELRLCRHSDRRCRRATSAGWRVGIEIVPPRAAV